MSIGSMIIGEEGANINFGPINFNTLVFSNIIDKIFRVIIIIIIMNITIKLGNKIINLFVKRQIKSNTRFKMDSQKAKTVGTVLKSVLKYSTYFLGIALIIGELFSNLSVAVAGIGTFTVGLASQNLIKDIINGFFILFEDHFGIGDHVTLGEFSGIVDSIGIRTTKIRDFNGDIHLIPNGSITTVTNHSRSNMSFIVDVDIAYEEDVDKAISTIKKVCLEFQKNNSDVTDTIDVIGITSITSSSVTIRVVGKSKPLSQWKMERDLRRLIKLELDKEEIKIPYTKTRILKM